MNQPRRMLAAILFLLLVCSSPRLLAQTFFNYFVTIPDPNDAPDPSTFLFTDAGLNTIAANYTIRQFHLAFPNSISGSLTDVYLVEVDDPQFLQDLSTYDPVKYQDVQPAEFRQFYITINDSVDTPVVQVTNNITTVSFTHTERNDLLADYTFRIFHRAFPYTNDAQQYKVFLVDAATANTYSGTFPLIDALENFDNVLFANGAEVDYKRFIVSITDDAYVPTPSPVFTLVSSTAPVFLHLSSAYSALNTILNKYSVSQFFQLHENSGYEHLRQLYYVECNSMQLLTDMINYNNAVFPAGREDAGVVFGGAHTPNDMGHAVVQPELPFIKAPDAWGYVLEEKGTIGDPNIKVGVLDSWFNLNHPELDGKISNVISNTPTHAPLHHGTLVAGFIAAKTDNDVDITDPPSIASIGYNTQLMVHSMAGDKGTIAGFNANMLKMSKDHGARVLNGSWMEPDGITSANLQTFLQTKIQDREMYNQIYENGTVAVFCAGNGGHFGFSTGTPAGDADEYAFPASYDHNLSITSVGHINTDIFPANPNQENIKDAHLYKPHTTDVGWAGKSHQHNNRVDLCAPGYDLNGLSENGGYTSGTANGTSFAAPLVTGTVALMLQMQEWLSPYQVEQLLKKTASKSMLSLAVNSPFAGQLGAGRLDAYEAVKAAHKLKLDQKELLTMEVRSIEINHACLGYTVPVKFKPTVINHNVAKNQLAYEWVALPGNTCSLSSYTAEQPEIVSSTPSGNNPDIAYFVLTVRETSSTPSTTFSIYPPKVASRRIKLMLHKDGQDGMDLSMRDAYGDPSTEAPFDNNFIGGNNMEKVDWKDWNIWHSPDVWNRTSQYADLNAITDDSHQNPEYDPNNPNYMYVRIKNIGCATSPATTAADRNRVLTYWTIASSGEKWPGDWDGTTNFPSTSHPTGDVIDPDGILIPALAVGEVKVIEFPWYPPNPDDYFSAGTQLAACALARIERRSPTSNSFEHPFGMTFGEVTNEKVNNNVWRNNNIITRNLVIVDNVANKMGIIFANAEGTQQTFGLEVASDKLFNKHHAGDISRFVSATLHLGDLFDVWEANAEGTYEDIDYTNRTITFDLMKDHHLDNITLAANAKYPIEVEINLKDSISVPDSIIDQLIHIRQTYIDGGKKKVYGNVSFAINIPADTTTDTSGNKGSYINDNKTGNNNYLVFPNPVNKKLSILSKNSKKDIRADVTITDVIGRTVFAQQNALFNNGLYEINTSQLMAGVYFVKVNDMQGENATVKIVKVE